MRSKKNRKKILIAATLGVFATFSVFSLMNSQKAVISELNRQLQEQNSKIADIKNNSTGTLEEEKKVEENKVSAVVASRDIKIGETFVLENIKLEDFFEEDMPSDVYKTTASVVGQVSAKNIAAGQFIKSDDILSEDVTTIDIPRGMRAVTASAETFNGLASHIRVGSMVDILTTTSPPEFIAQNIKIVSFEPKQTVAPTPGNERFKPEEESVNPMYLTASQASAITFLVPSETVSRVVDAFTNETLQILARNNNDSKLIMTESSLPPPPSLMEEIPVIAEPIDLPPPKEPAPPAAEVEVIKAGTVSTLTFDSNKFLPEDKSSSTEPSAPDLTKFQELLELAK